MFFSDGRRDYPHLVAYLRAAARRPGPGGFRTPSDAAFAIGSGAVAIASGVVLAATGAFVALIPAVVALGAWAAYRRLRPEPPPSPDTALREAADRSVRTLLMMLEHRRLHRDLDRASLELLEECARHRTRVEAALSAEFWAAGGLPDSYRAVRNQAMAAADRAMDEVMALYGTVLPDRVDKRAPIDYVEEALESTVFLGRNSRAMFPPAPFEAAFQVGGKLQLLADEAEAISHTAMQESFTPRMTAPGSALDLSIGEMRSIRQAEEELRQNT